MIGFSILWELLDDVLIDQQGKITALIIGVGGFLDIGRKDFSQPFAAASPCRHP
jgi:hypothetical protein